MERCRLSTLPALLRRLGSSLRQLLRPPPADLRGGQVLAVIECHLNPNARDAGAARHAAFNPGLLQACAASSTGLVQLPCPELACLGPRRARRPDQSLRDAMQTPASRQRCAHLAEQAADQLLTRVQTGCTLLAVVGGNAQSPGCAVHVGAGGLRATSGSLMLQLQAAMRARRLDPPFVPLRDDEPATYAQDLALLQVLMRPGVPADLTQQPWPTSELDNPP